MTDVICYDNAVIFNKPFALIAISNLLANCVCGIFFVFPLFILHIGGGKRSIGVLMGIMSLAAVLCRPWVSVWVDRLGRKKSFIIGCIMMSVVSLSHLLFQRNISSVFGALLVLRLLFGMGWAMCLVGAFTLATDIIPQSRFNQGVGIFGITNLLGIALGPLLAEWLVRRVGFSAMFIAAAIIGIAAVGFALSITDRYAFQGRQSTGSFFQVLRIPRLLKYTLIALCLGFSLAAHAGFVTPFAAERGLGVGLYFMAYSAMAILSRVAGGRMADRVGEATILPFALLCTASGFFLLTIVDTTPELIVSGLITGFGHGLTTPCLLALAIRPIPNHKRGKANGLFSGGFDTGIFAGSLVLGVIGDRFGFYMLFISAGTSLLIAILANAFWRVARDETFGKRPPIKHPVPKKYGAQP